MFEMSPTVGKLGEALSKAQLVMRPAAMDSNNPFFKSKYASLASVLEASHPLAENGLSIVQGASVLRAEGQVCVEISALLIHSSGEWVKTKISLKPGKDDPQAVGSCITYGRRYLISALAGIASDDDDDGNSATPKGNTEKKPLPPKTPIPASKKPSEGKTIPADTKTPLSSPNEDKKPPVENPNGDTGKKVADQLKLIREGSIKLGAKTNEEIRLFVGGLVKRKIESVTIDLTADERKSVLEIIIEEMKIKGIV